MRAIRGAPGQVRVTFSPPMPSPSRATWTWHRWLGLSLLLPLAWWTGTALVFALRAMEEIHGQTWSTGAAAERQPLDPALLPPAEALGGATAVALRRVEGHQVAVVERGAAPPQVLDLPGGRSLGEAIPVAWAEAAARRDFTGPFEPEAVYLHRRAGAATPLAGGGPAVEGRPEEYAGPLPAYAFHLRGEPGMHLYVDALDGTVRARRTGPWRLYDWAFRLHALDFLPDAGKRLVIGLVTLAWLALGFTGLRLVTGWLRRRRAA